jgi:hypothetical protein
MLLASNCDGHDEPWHQSQRLSKDSIDIEIYGIIAVLSCEARPFQPLKLYHHFSMSYHFYLLSSCVMTSSFSIFVILRISNFIIQNALTSTPDETWFCLLRRLPTRRWSHRHSIFSFLHTISLFLGSLQLHFHLSSATIETLRAPWRS